MAMLAGFSSTSLSANAMAQSNAMAELYGMGVHAYFGHDYVQAEQMLSQVAASGTKDSRVFYFLGLAREMNGGGGQSDFDTGARLEAEGHRVVNVGSALSRVQGSLRGKIEQARRSARVAVLQEKLAKMAERASKVPVPDPMAVPTQPEVTSGPFGTDEGMASSEKSPAADPETTAAAGGVGGAATDATTDPFSDDPEPAAADPFATDAGGAPADPFNNSGPAADPFNTDTSAPDTSDPFSGGGSDPFSGGDDPFK
ncbi:MAG TPA: hypothetical protein DDW52_00985 [Planctomycetaceae bacterium]|nr:hypothetical protein [Planctomycetaceae bacterium]